MTAAQYKKIICLYRQSGCYHWAQKKAPKVVNLWGAGCDERQGEDLRRGDRSVRGRIGRLLAEPIPAAQVVGAVSGTEALGADLVGRDAEPGETLLGA